MQPNWRKLNPPYSSGLVGPRERILPTRNSQLFPPITNHQSFIIVFVTPPCQRRSARRLIYNRLSTLGSSHRSLFTDPVGSGRYQKKSAPHFQRSAFMLRRGCATQLQ